jgi:hypothetical protein
MLRVLIACGLMIASAYAFQPVHGDNLLGLALILALLGIITFRLALRSNKTIDRRSEPAIRPYDTTQSNWLIAALGILGMALLAEANGNLLHTGLTLHVHTQFVLLCISIALLVRGVGGSLVPLSKRREGLQSAFLIPLAITFLAFALRVWALDDTIHFFIDEFNFANGLMRFWDSSSLPLLAPFGWPTAFPAIFPYLQADVAEILGHNLIGLRFVSVVFGTLTVPALYLLAKALFDRKTAILAALLLATFPPHLHFSRLGLNNIADPLCGTLALAFLSRGLRWRRCIDFALAGAFLGLTQYFYEVGRLLYPPLILLWLIAVLLISRRRRAHPDSVLSPQSSSLFSFALSAFVVGAPIYYTLEGLQAMLAPRFRFETLDGNYWTALLLSPGGELLLEQLQRTTYPFLMTIHYGDGHPFYGGEHPLILGYLAPAALLGLAYAIWRWRRPGALLLLLWITLTSLGNSLLITPTSAARYVVEFPALTLLIAVGISAVTRLLLPERRAWLLAGALTIVLAVLQIGYYFGPHLSVYNYQVRLFDDGQDALFRSADFPPGTQVHVIGFVPLYEFDREVMLRYLGLDIHLDVWWDRLTHERIVGLPRDVDHAFFLEPEDTYSLDIIRQYFDLEPPQYSPFNVPADRQLVLYYAPRGTT